MSPWDPAQCVQTLTEKGLTPVCDEVCCEEILDPDQYHASCGGRDPYFPVQTIGCHNVATGAWQYPPVDQLMAVYEGLHVQDPHWELAGCYCCCG